MGLVHVPSVLFLDEPTLGLDITSRRRLWRHVRQVRRAGTTVLLTTHYLDEADALCDRVAIIHEGRIREIDAPAKLKRRYGRATLHVRVDHLDDADPGLPRRLREHPLVRRVRVTGPVIEIETGDVVPVTEAVLAECRAFGVTPRDLWTERASLDDVFLALTGQALRS
jgi:ABC-2 type transport system ATP-binding protein